MPSAATFPEAPPPLAPPLPRSRVSIRLNQQHLSQPLGASTIHAVSSSWQENDSFLALLNLIGRQSSFLGKVAVVNE